MYPMPNAVNNDRCTQNGLHRITITIWCAWRQEQTKSFSFYDSIQLSMIAGPFFCEYNGDLVNAYRLTALDFASYFIA